jgi:hypothetical protein
LKIEIEKYHEDPLSTVLPRAYPLSLKLNRTLVVWGFY